jgi:hypothetical protein
MTEVDSPDERNVTLKKRGMAHEHQLLVVRSAPAHSLVEQNFASRLGNFNCEASIFFRTKRKAIAVRTPEQSSNVDAQSTSGGQERCNRCSVNGYPFVSVSAPIGKANLVVRLKTQDGLRQTGEIRDPIDKTCHAVAFGPRIVSGPMRVDLSLGVAPLL